MKYDFDEVVDRRNTLSTKWHVPEDVIPLPVADMDFRTAEPIIRELVKFAEFGVYGYSYYPDSYGQAVKGWMKRRHGWELDTSWICLGTTVVVGLNFAIQAYSQPGEGVIIQQPVYYPFYDMVALNHRKAQINQLVLRNGRYEIDFDNLRSLVALPDTKLMIMCSPHNPSGRIWTAEELHLVLQICMDNGLLLLVDEIHADIVFPGHEFVPLGVVAAEMGVEALSHVVICTSASKSFNIAGLHTSSIIIPDEDLRKRYLQEARRNNATSINAFGVLGTQAAYNEGEEWLEQMLAYVKGNFDLLNNFFIKNLPDTVVYPNEATYLAWIDCRAWGLSDDELEQLFEKEAKVTMNNGCIFGAGGSGFVRLNLACRRALMEEALARIKAAYDTAVKSRGCTN